MHFNSFIAAAILAFTATNVLAAPIPQLAGEGGACDSIFSSTDNGIGYGIEDAENNVAGNISGAKGATRRQLAGEGSACNSVLSGTDNAVGYGIEDAENNLAANIGGAKGGAGTGGGSQPPPPPPPHRARQLDKIANGFQAIGDAAGVGAATSPVTGAGDSLDGTLTGGAANLGAQIGDTEVKTLEGVGSAVPKRQLDKIANGFQAIGDAAGIGAATSPVTGAGDSLDGTLTGGAANLGAQIGDTEVKTLEGVGSAVPK